MSLVFNLFFWPALLVTSSLLGFVLTGKLQFLVRTICIILLTAIGSIFGILTGCVLYPIGLGYHVNYYTGHFYNIIVSIFLGITYNFEGLEHLDSRRPCVFVANHQSSLDVASIGGVFPKNTVIMAKNSLFWIPFLGQYTYLSRNIFINRSNRTSAMETMNTVAKLLEQDKIAMWMFPEGTRSRQTDNSLLPFKKGAFHLAVSGNGMPIIPIVFSTYDGLYSTKQMRFEGGVINVKVLPPIETVGMADKIDELLQTTRNQMLETLQSISTQSKKDL
ncbi:1-acylglycerol-3-phosphate O-acyltransferase [Nowakowskiella sp. JEL0078]|nr:1-acylglycerol-3-phosphate O-acyltransferase [Nowakowskiella sp. JEL0078]